jgi:hypothetical protein
MRSRRVLICRLEHLPGRAGFREVEIILNGSNRVILWYRRTLILRLLKLELRFGVARRHPHSQRAYAEANR